jgi:hypothetical protein
MFQEVSRAIEHGSHSLIEGLVYDALDAGDAPKVILNEDMLPAIGAVFEKYSAGTITISQLRVSVTAFRKGIETLRPFLSVDCITPYGSGVIDALSIRHVGLAQNLATLVSDCLAPAGRIFPGLRLRRHRLPDNGTQLTFGYRRSGTVQLSGSPERVNIQAYEEVI